MNQEHAHQLQVGIEAVKSREISNFYFVACGGSLATLTPAQYILDREIEIPSAVYSSNEFILRAPKALGPTSVVISCSHSGTTPETVQATEFARSKGALTISLTHLADSPLWNAAEYKLHYDWGTDARAEDNNYGILYRLIFGILDALQPHEKYAGAIASVETGLHDAFERNKAMTLETAKAFGSQFKREPLIYTMASGINYSHAYSFAICLLQEMQWIHSSAIHAGEYFHGPFEITDYDVPFIIIKGIGETRPMDDRAHDFCRKYSDKIVLIDAETFDMEGISADVRNYFANLIAGVVLRQYAQYLSEFRGHPLSVRRYMWKMEY
ncbi:SIS domain-containing protein [Paenibacillus doosanensis]|uniref:SIS domain-containing protein n=1 Tax=Paenibacillus doosanensis TaxID=1229154 RepID=UPI0021808A15|nr:SIS domain-containing protein [Paenibacillus doosanensis]MCS7460581.1 SIS domain-containing protein [Paenibacillus doosanensis]